MSGVAAFLKRVYQLIVDFFWPPPDPDTAYDEAIDKYNTYQTTKKLEDLLTAITSYDYALKLRRTSDDQAELPGLLVNYAVALWDRYKDDTDSSAEAKKGFLESVIKMDEEARQLWKEEPLKGDRYSTLLTNLAKAYMELSRIDPIHAIDSLGHSLSLNREVYDNPSHFAAAFGIGEVLWARYVLNQFADEINEQNQDIDAIKLERLGEAITKFKESLEYAEATNNSSTRVACYYFIAKAYDARYSLSRLIADLDSAIDYNRRAGKTLDEKDPRMETCLHDLCLQLLHKYDSDPRNRAPLQEAKILSQGKFHDIAAIIDNREHRQATMP